MDANVAIFLGVQMHRVIFRCGYGGLLIALGPVFSESLLLGLEIREKVCAGGVRRSRLQLKTLRPTHSGQAKVYTTCCIAQNYKYSFVKSGDIRLQDRTGRMDTGNDETSSIMLES